jgi:hypothetical protein
MDLGNPHGSSEVVSLESLGIKLVWMGVCGAVCGATCVEVYHVLELQQPQTTNMNLAALLQRDGAVPSELDAIEDPQKRVRAIVGVLAEEKSRLFTNTGGNTCLYVAKKEKEGSV